MSVEYMAGRFEGLSDLEWKLFNGIFPPEPEKRERGMPHTPFRYVLNTLLYRIHLTSFTEMKSGHNHPPVQ